MEQYNIKMRFSAPTETGLIVTDATRNKTGAYKVRGALAGALAAKNAGQYAVCTASAGNHGAGLAYAAQLLGLQARIFVPENAPKAKTDKIEAFGSTVTRVGDTFDACLAAARSDLRARGQEASFVHPFDQESVVAGQGTIGVEILRHALELSNSRAFSRVRIFVPVGGGGLAGGIASVIKNAWPDRLPTPEIIGVIDESSPASLLGTYFGRPVRAVPDTIADGTRVALVGNTFISLAPLLDRILLIPHDAIVYTMHSHFQATGDRLEASGALALAGEAYARRLNLFDQGESALSYALISGRNVDQQVFDDTVLLTSNPSTSTHVRCAYDVRIPEKPGQLRTFLSVVKDYNITGLTYKQFVGSTTGTLRVDFDLEQEMLEDLDRKITQSFPGSILLRSGQHALLQVGAPVAHSYRDELVTLEDRPGSFLHYIEELNNPSALGSVGFLFYRKPALAGARAQVVIGREHCEPLSCSIAQ
jgi:threonine dehydratase